MTWYAHRIAGLTIAEQELTEDDSEPLEHLVLRPHRSNISIRDIHRLLWDATPETARLESKNEGIITLSSDELAALIAAHATDLKRCINRACESVLTRLVPRIPE